LGSFAAGAAASRGTKFKPISDPHLLYGFLTSAERSSL
jgi:hypothetical protein